MVIARLHPYIFGIFITAYESGKMQIDTGPELTKSEIRNYLYLTKYKYRERRVRTEVEKRKIWQRRMRKKGSSMTLSRGGSRSI